MVYSRDRAKRLRIVLWLALVLGAFIGILEVGALRSPDTDHAVAAVALGIYLLVTVLAGVTLWLLVRRDMTTRLSATVTGTFLAIVGVLTIGGIFGLAALLIGLGLLALALLPDDPGDGPR